VSKDEQLREIQKRIAQARGYTDVGPTLAQPGVASGARAYLVGTLHGDEGPTILPRWPWDWCDAAVLVEEMERYPFFWEASRSGSIHGVGQSVYRFAALPGMAGYGATLPEAISRCWCAWKGIDLSDIP
jgi:hypothetical protein